MEKPVYILGISCFYHDAAACIIRDGEITAAAQEERFTRKKHDASFPKQAIAYCFRENNITANDLTNVVFYDKPFIKFERLIETYLAYAPFGIRSFLRAMPLWLKDKLFIRKIIAEKLSISHDKVLFAKHHESHAASAFFPSPFESAVVIVADGVGEWATTSIVVGNKNKLTPIKEINFPHSLGLLYSAFTYYLGFKVNSGEYKVMGLAPYGKPKFVDLIFKNLVDVKEDGSFHLHMEFFNYCTGLTMTNSRFHNLFGQKPRMAESPLEQFHMDIAASLQQVTNEIMLKIARYASRLTGERNLCLAGGVALNCVANGKILQEKIFDNIWIQPAAGDAGGALGAALAVWHKFLDKPRIIQSSDTQNDSLLGPSFSNDEIKTCLDDFGAIYDFKTISSILTLTTELLQKEMVVGWFQGRMEFGPRALGSRSIIGDARSINMQSKMNLKIKFRESFRPFAPTVLREKVSEWFELDRESPYMLLVANVKNSKTNIKNLEKYQGIEKLKHVISSIPAVTHVDGSARIQTINRNSNATYYDLIDLFNKKTGCPVIINTSFNVRGEPIVCSPEDAFRCFMRTEMDYLIIGNYILDKTRQPNFTEKGNWKKEYELD